MVAELAGRLADALIAALRTFTELQHDGQLEEDQRREFLERSTEQISRLEWMSNNLLDLSRIDSGIFPLDMRSGDLRDPVRSAVEAQAEIAEQRGISVVSRVPTSPVMLRFDRERILQLLGNLIGNALKFTPRGGEVIVELVDAPGGCHLSSATQARASRRRSCRASSIASSAARTWARHAHRERPRPGDRSLDRGDARRPYRGRERGGHSDPRSPSGSRASRKVHETSRGSAACRNRPGSRCRPPAHHRIERNTR